MLKSFFSVLENDCLQSHESHQLSFNIKISAHLFFQRKSVKPIIIQEFSFDRNDKVKMTVKDKIEKLKQFLQERSVEAVKTIIYIFQDFNMFNFVLF